MGSTLPLHRRDASLWAITSYYNPFGFGSRLRNYRRFRERLSVPLVTVELSYRDRFELTPDDADELVQVRGQDILWQKERLLNLALKALPTSCTKLIWMDCDVFVVEDGWPESTCEALERHRVVQPFTVAFEAASDAPPTESGPNATLSKLTGLVSWLSSQPSLRDALRHTPVARHGRMTAWGFAWAARREVIEPHGFYDACIVGGGDRAMLFAAFGVFERSIESMQMNRAWAEHYLAWARPFYGSIRSDVGHVEGTVYHLWHGAFANRQYRERHARLAEHDFDPARDVRIDRNGCWEWNSDKPALHEFVRRYFLDRREDG